MSKYKSTYRFSIAFIVIIFVGACTTYTPLLSENIIPNPPTYQSPQLLFLNIALTANTANIISSQLKNGRLKKKPIQGISPDLGQLLCQFLDVNKVPIIEVITENPLDYYAEYLDEDNIFKRQRIQEETGNIQLRIQYNPNLHFLSIHTINDSLQLSKLDLIPLK